MLSTTLLIIASLLILSADAFVPSSSFPLRHSVALRMADIVDTAVSAGKFKTLAAALGAANLIGTLKTAGPFTVFAPTDEAFSKLPEGVVDALLKDKNKLSAILTYHVLAGSVPASTVVTLNGKDVKTVNGADIKVQSNENGVKLGSATVVATDIMCDNGVIHIIDSVMLPPGIAIPVPEVKPSVETEKRVLLKPRQAQWFPMLLSPKALDGSLAGDVGFDPLGFGNDKEGQPAGQQVRYMREAELKHGRLAMLAGLGWPTSELYHKQLAEILNLESILTPEGRAPSVMNGGLLNGWIEATGVGFLVGAAALELLASGKDKTKSPGNIGFDPLRLYTFRSSFGLYIVGEDDFKTKEQKAADARKDMELCEVKHSRLAMIGITGFAFQELIAGTPVVEQTPFFFGDPIM